MPLPRPFLRAPARAPAVYVIGGLPDASWCGGALVVVRGPAGSWMVLLVVLVRWCWRGTAIVGWTTDSGCQVAVPLGGAGMPLTSGRRHTGVLGLRSGARLDAGGISLGTQQRDRGLEVLEGVEGLVDAREAQVRHLVELAERAEDRQAHLVGVDLGVPLLADALLDPLGQQRQVVLGDRTALAGLGHRRGPCCG